MIHESARRRLTLLISSYILWHVYYFTCFCHCFAFPFKYLSQSTREKKIQFFPLCFKSWLLKEFSTYFAGAWRVAIATRVVFFVHHIDAPSSARRSASVGQDTRGIVPVTCSCTCSVWRWLRYIYCNLLLHARNSSIIIPRGVKPLSILFFPFVSKALSITRLLLRLYEW